jgi:hypothetical protein
MLFIRGSYNSMDIENKYTRAPISTRRDIKSEISMDQLQISSLNDVSIMTRKDQKL